ncbi:hypothetical protein EDB83DRAFT_2312244 [Lactarius deliciosus]|nr:hypothetical protein EDB83DRAFT_2312244 [Lactarius deliciosus]
MATYMLRATRSSSASGIERPLQWVESKRAWKTPYPVGNSLPSPLCLFLYISSALPYATATDGTSARTAIRLPTGTGNRNGTTPPWFNCEDILFKFITASEKPVWELITRDSLGRLTAVTLHQVNVEGNAGNEHHAKYSFIVWLHPGILGNTTLVPYLAMEELIVSVHVSLVYSSLPIPARNASLSLRHTVSGHQRLRSGLTIHALYVKLVNESGDPSDFCRRGRKFGWSTSIMISPDHWH